jgi:hypothetical protein
MFSTITGENRMNFNTSWLKSLPKIESGRCSIDMSVKTIQQPPKQNLASSVRAPRQETLRYNRFQRRCPMISHFIAHYPFLIFCRDCERGERGAMTTSI